MEQLAGRLKWERTAEGIRVAIPSRRGAMTGLYGPVVGVWLVAAAIRYWHLLEAPHTEGSEFTLQLIALGVYALGFCFAVCWLAWTFTNETLVILDKSELKIQRRAIGIDIVTSAFPNQDAAGFRFIAPTPSWASFGEIDPKTSSIQFQAGKTTRTFAAGITEEEAFALFDRMLRVYKFPGYLVSTATRPAF